MRLQISQQMLRWLPVAVGLLVIVPSCKKVFDLEPKNTVDSSQMYRNVTDADAAVIGIYGKVMKLAKTYVLFNELRADLMDITTNSDPYLRQLNEHNVTTDNPYANPRPFYEVILSCNDVLKNFRIMAQQNKMKQTEYMQRYSDIGAIRTWLYLQLGIHYGNIPYTTDPLEDVNGLQDVNRFKRINLDVLIDSLVAFAETLPFTEDYPTGTSLQTIVDGYSTSKFFINKNILLGDLYLWDGQYEKAALSLRKVLDINGETGQSEQFYNQYKISFFNEAGITYTRVQDFSSLVYTPGWRYLFERGQDNPFNYEWIWVLPFDRNYAPENPFIDLFSINGGSYLVRPSQQAMDYWNEQSQVYVFNTVNGTTAAVFRENFPFDSRGVFSYKMINGQPVIMKYLYNYLNVNGVPINTFNKAGKWFLTRAATLHLHFAEAANRAGQSKVAYALTNRGIKEAYDPLPGATTGRDVTNFQQTFLPPPYNFDAREGDGPRYRNTWYRNQGIRGRAAVKPVVIDSVKYFNMSGPLPRPLVDVEGFRRFIEDMIIHEDALELAYEGQRWSDLLRIAIRRNDPSFIADKVYNKLIKSGLSAGAAAQAKSKLLAKNWFLPFKWG
ncbi:MAG: RagB/SusD family nutrient uptake outer membrane protein [Chitinophagaceae bacterium]